MVALAIVVIILWMVWQVRKGARISYDTVFTAAIVGIPSGVVVSRLLHVIDNIVVCQVASRTGSCRVVNTTAKPGTDYRWSWPDYLGCCPGGCPGYLGLQQVQQVPVWLPC